MMSLTRRGQCNDELYARRDGFGPNELLCNVVARTKMHICNLHTHTKIDSSPGTSTHW